MEISGCVGLVTGAGSGIGRASAVALARAGAAAVAVVDVDEAAAGETAALVEAEGAQALVMPADVSRRDQLQGAFASTLARFDRLDVVHNNAGLVSGAPDWPGTSLERIERVVGVNVLGTFMGTKLAVDVMASRGGGAVVNTASVAGQNPMPTDPVYAATKAAIILFTQSCAALPSTHGVRVNAVLPGITDTSMLAKTGDGAEPAPWLDPVLPYIRLLAPEEVAAAVLELVRDDSKAGETLVMMNELAGSGAG